MKKIRNIVLLVFSCFLLAILVPETVNAGESDDGRGALAVVNVDAETGEYLEGSVFCVYNDSGDYLGYLGELIGTYTTDENGYWQTCPISYQIYYIVQVEAPEGYSVYPEAIRIGLTKEYSYSGDYPWVIKVENYKTEDENLEMPKMNSLTWLETVFGDDDDDDDDDD